MSGCYDVMIPGICGMGLHLQLDGFRLIYVTIAVIMWAVSGVFSLEYMEHYPNRSRYYLFFWLTFFATVGVFLSADLYTTFIFFEMMSFTSYVWVAFDERKESLRAAGTYLAVAVIGGMVMLMGLFMLYHLIGTLEIDKIAGAVAEVAPENRGQLYVIGGLLLFGFGAKAGCFPLHIWLPKAHPVAPAPASALLSGILTKSGIFGILVVSCRIFGADANWGFLIECLGLVTMFLGAFLALFSVNLKRTLACSSVSQIGFILVGVGMYSLLAAAGESTALAARGALLHMVNHSMFKLVLFLCAGAVYMRLHQLELNEIRGYGRHKPVLKFCFLMGALGIAGVPLWSGYVSKTLLHESIVEYQYVAGNPVFWKFTEWVFLISGGMTAAYMTKLFVAVFVEKNEDPEIQAKFDGIAGGMRVDGDVRPGSGMRLTSGMRPASALVLAVPAAALFFLGMAPNYTMDKIADLGQSFLLAGELEHSIHYFSLVNLKGSVISLGSGAVLYVFVVRKLLMQDGRYVDRWPGWLDLENMIYRPVLLGLLPGVFGAVCSFLDRYLISTIVTVFLSVSAVVCRAMDSLADGFIRLARGTTHRQLAEPVIRHEDDQAAIVLGAFLDKMSLAGYRLSGGAKRKKARPQSHIPELMQKEEVLLHVGKMVEDSFSFGLMLFCIGLCLTLGYLLFVFFRMT